MEGGFGLLPTALSNVVTDRGDRIIQSVPVWNVRVTLFYLGSIGGLQNIQVFMPWHLFFLLFLDTNEAIPASTSRTAIRTTTLFSRQLTCTPSNDRLSGFFHSHNDCSYKDLRTFTASLLVHLDPLSGSSLGHGDNKTDIDQSVLACRHTFNVHSSSPHSPSQSNTCHWHLRRPYCRQKAPNLTFCARLTIKQSSSLELPLPARFWPWGDLLSETILARSFLRYTTVPLFFGWLQHGLTFGRLPSQPSHFCWSVYLCHVPTVVYRYSLLWERIVLCHHVISVSM